MDSVKSVATHTNKGRKIDVSSNMNKSSIERMPMYVDGISNACNVSSVLSE